MSTDMHHSGGLTEAARTSIWIVIVAGASVLFSLALACATPFAALATVAAMGMRRRAAVALIGVTWLANQAVGYLLLGYPRTWDSFAWGAAIGLAALLATLVVVAYAQRLGTTMVMIPGAFLAAFAVYESVLFAATAVLPSSAEAFSLSVVSYILWMNALGLVVLLALHRAAEVAGLIAGQRSLAASAIATAE